jgi:hypothetical protein
MTFLRFYKEKLHQKISYWAPATKDKWSDDTFSAPTTLNGLWFDRMEEFVDWRGDLAYSNATVYLDDEVELLGWLYLGETESTDPKNLKGAHPIRRVDKLPSHRAGYTLTRARL